MPLTPSSRKRLPAGLLAAAALDSLETTQVGSAFLDRLLRDTAPGTGARPPAGEAIHLRRRPVETEIL